MAQKQDILDFKLWIKKVKFTRFIDGIKKIGYYCRLYINGTAGFDSIAKYASRNTSTHKAEVKMSLELCMEAAAELLKHGAIVDLGPMGKFYPGTTSPWAEDPKDLKLDNVKLKITYKPSEELNEYLKGTTLHWMSESAQANPSNNNDANTPENDTTEIIDNPTNTSTGTVDTSTGTVDTSTGSNTGGDDIPTGNG